MGGGIVSKIVAVLVFVIGTLQFINLYFKGYDALGITSHVLPLFLISILVFKRKYSIVFSLSCVAVGVLTTVLNEDIQNYAGSVFIACAFFFIPNVPYGIFLILTTIISISIKSNLYNMNFNTSISLMLAYFIVYSLLYFVAYKKIENLKKEIEALKNNPPEKIINIDVIGITEEEKGMLKLFCRGVSYEKISQFMGLNNAHDTIRRKITGLRNKYNKKTDAEFVKWLYDSV